MNKENEILLEYLSNEKPKYENVYKYIKDNIIEPKLEFGIPGKFINTEVLDANIKQLYHRAMMLEMVITKLKEEK